MPDQSFPRLRWYQYRLRTLLLLMTAFAVFMSWFTIKRQQAERQRQIISEVRSSGIIEVLYDYEIDEFGKGTNVESRIPDWLANYLTEDFFSNVVAINVIDPRGTRIKNFEHINELTHLRYLGLAGARINNAELVNLNLGRLTHLQELSIFNDYLTDSDLEFVESLSQLQVLILNSKDLTDEALIPISRLMDLRELAIQSEKIDGNKFAHLKELKKLRYLSLESDSLSDNGMKEIAYLTQLEELRIFAPITDAGLSHVRNLSNLKKSIIRSDRITKEGVDKFKKALPKMVFMD